MITQAHSSSSYNFKIAAAATTSTQQETADHGGQQRSAATARRDAVGVTKIEHFS